MEITLYVVSGLAVVVLIFLFSTTAFRLLVEIQETDNLSDQLEIKDKEIKRLKSKLKAVSELLKDQNKIIQENK